MKARNLVMTAAVMAAVLAFGGESFARGGGGGGGMGGGARSGASMGKGTMTQTRSQSQTATQTQTRPEGSQRRDGTFLQTGTTANGSTARPSNGRGVMDGTGVNAPAPTTTTVQ